MVDKETFFCLTHSNLQQNVHAMHLPYDVKMLPFNMNNPSYKTHFGGIGQMKQVLGGIPVTAPHSMLPSRGSVAGTTEPW